METELALINSVTKYKDMASVLDSSIEESFKDLGEIWSFLKDHFKQYKTVPDLSFIQQQWGNLVEEVEVSASSKYYADKLKERHVKRRMKQMVERAGEMMDQGESSFRVLEAFQKNLIKLNKYSSSVEDLDITDIDGTIEHWENVKATSNEDGVPGISTGIEFIDSEYPTGLAPGQLIVTFGWSGKGKSWLAGLLATQSFDRGFSPMYVSLEMPGYQLRDRLITTMGDGLFSNRDMARGDIDLDNFRNFAKDKFDGKPKFHIVANEGFNVITPNVIQSKIEQHSPNILVVDFLQLMHDNEQSEGMAIRMMNLIYELKGLAMANHIPVVVISSVTPKATASTEEPPTLDMTAWSSAIDYAADLAMAVHRHNDSGLVEIVARKSRHSELFAGNLKWDYDAGTWAVTYD